MSNVIRLNNGGVIQVRTGVLQGIGPIGPRGLIGLDGAQGEDGIQGETGPPGAVLQYFSNTRVSVPQTINPDQDVLVAFGAVDYDDNDAFTSSTTIAPPEPGDYQISCWLRFNKPAVSGDGIRAAWLNSTVAATVMRVQELAVVDDDTYLNFSWPYRTVAGEVLKVYVRSGDDQALSLSAGALGMVRIGSGPLGNTGPQGPQGSVGATGPAGPTGVAGSASSGFTRYSDLLPH